MSANSRNGSTNVTTDTELAEAEAVLEGVPTTWEILERLQRTMDLLTSQTNAVMQAQAEAAEAEAALDGFAVTERETFHCIRACAAEISVRPRLSLEPINSLESGPGLVWPKRAVCTKCDRQWRRLTEDGSLGNQGQWVMYELLDKNGKAGKAYRSSGFGPEYDFVRRTS